MLTVASQSILTSKTSMFPEMVGASFSDEIAKISDKQIRPNETLSGLLANTDDTCL
jgi:hypothetical protein